MPQHIIVGPNTIPIPDRLEADFENFPVSNEAILESISGNTPADQQFILGQYGLLDQGVGSASDLIDANESGILNSPSFTSFRDQVLQYNDPGFEFLTREMLADESRSITASAIATGENAAAGLRRSGVGVTGLTGAFDTLAAVQGASGRASLESNRLQANAGFKIQAGGLLGELTDQETRIATHFGDQRFNLLEETLSLVLTTPGTVAEKTEGIRQFNEGIRVLDEENEALRVSIAANISAADMNGFETAVGTALSCLGAGAGFGACVAAAGIGWVFGDVFGFGDN